MQSTTPSASAGAERTPTTEAPEATTTEDAPSMTVAAPSSTTVPVGAPATTSPVETSSTTVSEVASPDPPEVSPPSGSVPPEWPYFEEGAAPLWPFHGIVQLWPDYDIVDDAEGEPAGLELLWSLRYWSWDASPDRSYPRVELPGLRFECLGRVALVYDEGGVEVGGASGVASAVFRVPWGGVAHELEEPSQRLRVETAARPSNVAVASAGDWVWLGSASEQRSYAMRDPARHDGARWRVQARHDGELFMLTVHPAHLPCYSGVTWLSLAGTGGFVMCGSNSAATAFVRPEGVGLEGLVLPDPDQVGDYLSCAAQLDLEEIPLTADRTLS